jgi:outer membrane protein insertion porin family/translocation and assembly module TamA
MKQLCLLLMVVLLWGSPLCALTVEDLDPHQEWKIKSITITGNEHVPTQALQAELVVKTRSWYTPWRPLPPFDPGTFATDLDRLKRFFQAHGYYEAQVSYDLQVDWTTHIVSIQVTIHEGEPVYVTELGFNITDQPEFVPAVEALRPSLSISEGKVFAEDDYQQAEAKIKEFFLDQHRGRVAVERAAQVIVEQHAARVHYTVTVGPATVFGDTRVEGTVQADPYLVTRELVYQPGEPFSAKAVEQSRKNVLKLDLFSSVRFLQEDSPADPSIIPMRVKVEEKPFHEWKLGAGYGTEDELRGQIRWRSNNWFGGGRQLSVDVKASSINRQIEVTFLQPHFLGARNRFSLSFLPQQVDEPGYLLNGTRLQPRLERDFSETLTGYAAYRLEYDRLNNVNPATIAVLKEFTRKGFLSGFGLGLVWTTTDDPLNPKRGGVVSFSGDQVGGFLGGDFNFFRLQGEAKKYTLITAQTVLAMRLKLGFADPFDGSTEVPLFERFFAGGANSVRGYGRHRLGPLSSADDPVGGRSLIEGSLELRHPLFANLGGALFLDFGQVSLDSFDVPIDDLRYALGFGVSYTTPIGPLRLDLGFPLRPPHGDQPWQVHFSIGQFF